MELNFHTEGHCDAVNITAKVQEKVNETGIKDGVAFVFVSHTTAALTINEDEEGVRQDLKDVSDGLVPEAADYKHHINSGDHNGSAHVKAAFMKPDLMVPVGGGKLLLGTWQNLFLVDFDEKPRERVVIVKVLPSK